MNSKLSYSNIEVIRKLVVKGPKIYNLMKNTKVHETEV